MLLVLKTGKRKQRTHFFDLATMTQAIKHLHLMLQTPVNKYYRYTDGYSGSMCC